MILEQISIKGFKSFAHPTNIKFINGVTCIVGPNGCGKSNITDAIQWVLGEQSSKHLRTKKMQDVIFNGTDQKSAHHYAEVVLTFRRKNPSKEEKQFIDIKRVIYRNGESKYFLDNEVVRLKDIRQLIMDTGIGIQGYSIIGQGNIEDILSDSKFNRRKIFEEASGISYLQYQKQESSRKLEKVELNLLRIEDIFNNLKKRISPLKREAERAVEYLDITQKIKSIEVKKAIEDETKYSNKLKSIDFELTELKRKDSEITLGLEDLIEKKY